MMGVVVAVAMAVTMLVFMSVVVVMVLVVVMAMHVVVIMIVAVVVRLISVMNVSFGARVPTTPRRTQRAQRRGGRMRVGMRVYMAGVVAMELRDGRREGI
jgi:type IV secretory pathway VirB3-like protein